MMVWVNCGKYDGSLITIREMFGCTCWPLSGKEFPRKRLSSAALAILVMSLVRKLWQLEWFVKS